jgi:antitoxin (DNA-binding transcriptional repressor) of toxin-antitoxin stability system
MRTVNIAELKNRLSAYIAYAKAGETVIIRDRNTAVAQLTPLPLDDDLNDEERELIASGIMRPRKRSLDLSQLRRMPAVALDRNAAVQAILDDRNEGI